MGRIAPRAGTRRYIDQDVITISAVCHACSTTSNVEVDRFAPSLSGASCSYCGRLDTLRECTHRTVVK